MHLSNPDLMISHFSASLLFITFLVPLHIFGQCVSVEDPPELPNKTGAWQDDDTVWHIPIVVHVLHGYGGDSIPADVIRSMFLDSVNADFRRHNWDTVHTQTSYLPIAVDTRIQFHFATTDPYGQPTEGITYRQTNGQTFNWHETQMMIDSLGGTAPWDVCANLNIWVCSFNVGQQLAEHTYPWNESGRIGVTLRPEIFRTDAPYRFSKIVTHFMAHFLGLKEYRTSQNCTHLDGIGDTPIQSQIPMIDLMNPDSIYPETLCDPIPEGRLGCNFMMPSFPNMLNRMNMFTQGQKDKMRELTAFYYPGFLNRSLCPSWTTIGDSQKQTLAVHPNPAYSVLRFDSPSLTRYTVMDASGRTVMQGQAQQGQNTVTVDGLRDGMYVLRLGDGSKAVRFVKVGQ
jgi:hypothetical protein